MPQSATPARSRAEPDGGVPERSAAAVPRAAARAGKRGRSAASSDHTHDNGAPRRATPPRADAITGAGDRGASARAARARAEDAALAYCLYKGAAGEPRIGPRAKMGRAGSCRNAQQRIWPGGVAAKSRRGPTTGGGGGTDARWLAASSAALSRGRCPGDCNPPAKLINEDTLQQSITNGSCLPTPSFTCNQSKPNTRRSRGRGLIYCAAPGPR